MPRLFSSGLNSCPQTTPQSLLRVLQAALMMVGFSDVCP